MNRVVGFVKWLSENFFYISLVLLIFLYIWWFVLNPLTWGPGEQASDSFVFGLILLFIYGLFTGTLRIPEADSYLKTLFILLNVFFLAVNGLFMFVYLPRLKANARFGNNTYYITSNFPFLECCGYHQLTKWEGMFRYETNFYRYNMPQVEFIYDKNTDEVSLVDVSDGFERLYETFGKSHRSYEGYAKVENHLYYSSARCNRDESGDCKTWTYILYQCELDNTSCNVLPIEYTTGLDGWVNLEAKESTQEVYFYFEKNFSPDKTLIYTYGEFPRCFVDGCLIIK